MKSRIVYSLAGGLLAAGITAVALPADRPAANSGVAIFAQHCASCHGADLKGVAGAHTPDLTDAAWQFGGDDMENFRIQPADVEKTVRFGIRSGHPQQRLAVAMPGTKDPASPTHGLSDAEIDDLVIFLQSIAKLPGAKTATVDPAAAVRGKTLYEGKAACFDCHSSDWKGDNSIGSTDLTSPATWLYGTDEAAIRET